MKDDRRLEFKKSALSSNKIDNYEYLEFEKILPSDERRMIKKDKFTYSSLEKALKKQQQQQKAIEDAAKKQTKALQKLNIDQQIK